MSKQDKSQEVQNSDATVIPRKWWQWFLLYPALLISVFASIPTYIEAFQSAKIGVDFGESTNAQKQADLWKKNLSCLDAPLDPLTTPNNTKVDATICKTGDVLVKIFTVSKGEFYQWVGVDDVVAETSFNTGLISSAYAEDYSGSRINLDSDGGVLCQKYQDSGRLLRRVSVPGKGCFDEIVNTYTGRVESKRPASCNSQC